MENLQPSSRPLSLRVRLPYSSEDEFVLKYGRNVGKGGVFVATSTPKAEGTALAFEFVLADGAPLFRGQGVVIRTLLETDGSRAGMTVQFQRLDQAGKALVERVLNSRQGGATPSPLPVMPSAPLLEITEPYISIAGFTPDPLLSKASGVEGGEPVLGVELSSRAARVAVVLEDVATPVPREIGGARFDFPSALFLKEGRPTLAEPSSHSEEELLEGLVALLGRRSHDSGVAGLTQHGPARVEYGPEGALELQWGGRRWTPTELVAVVLRSLREAAQMHVKGPVSRVVFTVPTSFQDAQRRALAEAATQAGLLIAGFIPCSVAAALAYAHAESLARKRLLVLHLDGATLDSSILEVTGKEVSSLWSAGQVAAPAEARGSNLGRGQAERLQAALAQVAVAMADPSLTSSALDGVLLTGDFVASATMKQQVAEKLGVPLWPVEDAASLPSRGAALDGRDRLSTERARLPPPRASLLGTAVELVVTPGGAHRLLAPDARLPAEYSVSIPCQKDAALELAFFQGCSGAWAFLGLVRWSAQRDGELKIRAEASADGLLQFFGTLPDALERPLPLLASELPSSMPAGTQPPAPPQSPSGFMRGLRKFFGRS